MQVKPEITVLFVPPNIGFRRYSILRPRLVSLISDFTYSCARAISSLSLRNHDKESLKPTSKALGLSACCRNGAPVTNDIDSQENDR